MSLTVWVDADACPRAVKDVLYRAADRRQVRLVLVANQFLRPPRSPFIETVQVPTGFDVADDTIVQLANPGDLVVTADIPLADAIVDKGATALSPRGTLYSAENIKEHLGRRNALDELRGSGVITGGPPALSSKDVQAFANALDRFLTRAQA